MASATTSLLGRRLGLSPGSKTHLPSGKARRLVAILIATLTLALPTAPALAAGEEPRPGMRPVDRSQHSGWETQDKSDDGSMAVINSQVINSTFLWTRGITGDGVTVALIDTGVVPVAGLDAGGKVVNGPDLSFDGPLENLRYLDLYGHGTHLAGIIAGSDGNVPGNPNAGALRRHFFGVAPDAQVVNVKVGDGVGAVGVNQVIAALTWVVSHRDDNGMNIRVINLAYGVEATEDYQVDPLAYAVEAAWKAGIVVVASAGNDGNGKVLRSPAFDPYVLAVGALDTNGTYATGDDALPAFTNCGTEQRSVDLLAPGQSVISLRDPGSYADFFYPEARVGDRFFRGTGSSQATAIVTGAVALLLEQRPDLTPDQVKALLAATAQEVPGVSELCQGSGLIDLRAAFKAPTPDTAQSWPQATNSDLYNQLDVDGNWDGQTWGGQTWGGQTWGGQTWGGQTWGGQTWGGQTWGGQTWGSYVWN